MKTWLARKTVKRKIDRETQKEVATIQVDLVYGVEKEGKIKGRSYHVLTGATAQESIEVFAESLNKNKITPNTVERVPITQISLL